MTRGLRFGNRKNLEWLPFALVIVSTAIYIIIWSYISVERILSLHATYFDLGSFMERLWSITNIKWNFVALVSVFSNTGLQFLMFPIAYVHSYTLVVVLQSAAIGLCALPIYGISRLIVKSKKISMLISTSFLIYFPVAGSNYFDVHFQSFFPILFISGYYFFLKKEYKLSLVLFFLSGTVRYPYFIFPTLFALIGIIEITFNKGSDSEQDKSEIRRKMLFFTIILIVGGALLGIRYITAGPVTNVPVAATPGPYNLFDRIITVLLFFGPFLFIPFLSKRWVLFFAPMLYLILLGPNIFYFPMILHDQYAVIIYPFIYLGLIEGLTLLKRAPKVLTNDLHGSFKAPSFRKSSNNKLLFSLVCMFIILILLDMVYEPYGPFNQSSPANYGLNQALNVNRTELEALSKIINLIPRDNPYVLTQNNLIELFPRMTVPPHEVIGLPLIAGMLDIGQNLTLKEIEENRIPFNTGFGTIYTNIDFVLADVNSSWYSFDSYGHPSMSTLISHLYNSGYYGLMAEDQGIILLKRGYKGPVAFTGMELRYLPSQLYPLWHAHRDNGQIVVSDSPMPKTDGLASWYGPYIGLPPGTYRVTFELSTTSYCNTNSIELQVTEWPQNLAVLNITGSSFSPSKKVDSFTLQFSTNQFLTHVEFRGVDAKWNGNLTLDYIKVQQLSPYG